MATVKKIRGTYRVVGDDGLLLRGSGGKAVDGGGHRTKQVAEAQARAVDSRIKEGRRGWLGEPKGRNKSRAKKTMGRGVKDKARASEILELEIDPRSRIGEKKAEENRIMVQDSLQQGTPLRIVYRSVETGIVTRRVVWPDYVKVAGTGRSLLVSWDETRGNWRSFSIDNIKSARKLER